MKGNRGGYRLSAIDSHPERDKIIKQMLDGVSTTFIHRWSGVSRRAIEMYRGRHIDRMAVRARQEIKDIQSIVDLANTSVQRLDKLGAAFEEKFIDPEDPTKFTTDIFAHEIDVVYTTTVDDPTRPGKQAKVKKRTTLQGLYDMATGVLSENAYDFNLTVKRSDDREVYTKIVHEMNEISANLLKTVAAMAGVESDVTSSEIFVVFLGALKRALAPFPGALEAVIAEFERESRAGPANG